MADKPKRSNTKYTADMFNKQLMLMNAEAEGKMMEILTGPKKIFPKNGQSLASSGIQCM